MDRRIALLRLLMVEIGDRERQAQQVAEQLRKQLPRIVDFAVSHNTSVSSALSSLADVEGRLREQEETLRHLTMLRERAQGELDALQVTRGVTDAHARLAELEARRTRLVASIRPSPDTSATPDPARAATDNAMPDEIAHGQHASSRELDEIEREIAELRAAIASASDAAARALTTHAPLQIQDIRTDQGSGLHGDASQRQRDR